MKVYDSAMEKVKGGSSVKRPQEIITEKRDQAERAEELPRAASQPTSSSTMISEAQAAKIRAQVRQAIQERFAKAR